MNKTLLLAAAASIACFFVAAPAQAGPGQKFKTFVERRGINEFTGQMIVRPLQLSDAVRKTGGLTKALELRQAAKDSISSDVIEYFSEVDEYVISLPPGVNENQYSQNLMATGRYQYVEPNWRVFPLLTPNDPQFPSQWHLTKINGPQAWDILVGNPNQIIAYTDTGIMLTHADLAANRVPGYNSASNLSEQNGGQVNDINGHGTHVSGIGSAIGNNNTMVCGVGWNFKIMMIRVTNSSGGGASLTDLIEGARWAAENGAKSVSTSYSGVDSSSIQTTGVYVNSLGCSYLYAAGNDGRNLSGFDHANVIIVGASNSADGRPSWSAYGRAVDVFAPGENILSTTFNGGTGTMSGTSMATPCANGVVAMVRAKNPSWTLAQVENQMFVSCKDLGTPGNDDTWGWGRVDLFKSVQGGQLIVDPSAYQIMVGTQGSGNLQSLFASDNNKLGVGAVPASSLQAPSTQVQVVGNSTNKTPTKVTIKFELASSGIPTTMKAEAFNFSTNQWVQIDTRAGSPTDTVVQIVISSNAAQYIEQSSGNLALRFSTFDNAVVSPNWGSFYDEVEWIIE